MDLKFRETDSLDEILAFINTSKIEGSIVWQNRNNKRLVYDVLRIQCQAEKNLVLFQLRNYDFSLLVNDQIYIKLSSNNTLFKGNVVEIDYNIIKVYIPMTVKTLELRGEPRNIFLAKDEKKVQINIAKEIGSEHSYHLAFNVLDISTGGISIIVSDENKKLIETSQMQLLTHLGSLKLSEPVLLDNRYEQKFRYRLRGKTIIANRFGYKFISEINKAQLQEFTSKN